MTVAGSPTRMAGMLVCGTLIMMRTVSICARRNSSRPSLAPLRISAPTSVLRAVMIPANGARISWKPFQFHASRCSSAWLAATACVAAATLARAASLSARRAS